MNEPVNVTRAALVKLLDAVPYPNSDDPGDPSPPWWGPYGPIGPIIGRVLGDLSWVLLNPQPLPPRAIGLVTRGALLDALLYPNPDDPGDPSPPWWGPYGPIGPVIGGVLRSLSWVLLNPQPLPPRDIGAVQKVLGRFRRNGSARREEVVYGNGGRLGFGVVLILVIISLSVWLLRRRTREEIAPAVPVEPEEEAVLLEEEGVVVPPPGAPSAEDVVTPIEDPPPLGEERPPGAY